MKVKDMSNSVNKIIFKRKLNLIKFNSKD